MTASTIPARSGAGAGAIALGLAFNVPFSLLAISYDYPDILRRPAAEALDRFAMGGPGLILTWYAFGLTALAFVPVAVALSLTAPRLQRWPALAVGAAVAGALAGLTQAIGLMRWVFVIPGLARAHADARATPDARAAAERAFDLLNAYGGVAIGEHLGQLLTALFVLMLSRLQWLEGRRMTAAVGLASAAALVVGSGEALAIALERSGEVFGLITIAGFLGLTAWLLLTGAGLFRGQGRLG